jgi:hypothetical protein
MVLRFGAVLSFLVIAAVSAVRPSWAHHSVAGQFDTQKTMNLVGVVSKVDWMNPHIYVYLDVKDENGKITTWQLETVPTAMARKAGLTKSMLLGDGKPVSIYAFPARDGTKNLGFIIKITYPDGRFFQFATDGKSDSASTN